MPVGVGQARGGGLIELLCPGERVLTFETCSGDKFLTTDYDFLTTDYIVIRWS